MNGLVGISMNAYRHHGELGRHTVALGTFVVRGFRLAASAVKRSLFTPPAAKSGAWERRQQPRKQQLRAGNP
jgi:hypothetical protein